MDIDFPRNLAPAVYDLNDFSSNYQFASASVLSAIGRKGKRGYLSKCFLIAVFYMWLSHN